jgi:acetone carboxylase, gamma subunit
MAKYTKEELKNLFDGNLPWARTHQIMSSFKDTDRFEKYIDILQESVSWSDRILLPIAEHLFIVEKENDKNWIVKCDCGHEFCEYKTNWKLNANIRVRETEEDLEEIYPGGRKSDVSWMVLREYYCPNCFAQLEVEAVPPGYPIIVDFEPDIEGFYRDWLKKPLVGGR